MKCKLYYSESRDTLAVNTERNYLQFSEEPNMFYVLTKEWSYIGEIEWLSAKDQWELINQEAEALKQKREIISTDIKDAFKDTEDIQEESLWDETLPKGWN